MRCPVCQGLSVEDSPNSAGVIIDAVRTPGGKRNGQLKDWHPASLAAHVLTAIEERNDLDPAQVDDVIMGCVMQAGAQDGMQAMDSCLQRLVQQGLVTPTDALEKALDKESFSRVPAVAQALQGNR